MLRGLDTNIPVYALTQQDREKKRRAEDILRDAVGNPHRYVVSIQVLAETVAVVSRKAPDVLPEAVRLVRLLSRVLRIVYYTHREVEEAATGPAREFWDRLLAYTYRNNGVGEIVSEDEKPYKGIIKTANPFQGPI